MKKLILPILLLALFTFITGCTSTTYGNKAIKDVTHEELKESVVVGETTRQEILARFGMPSGTTYNETGNLVIMYNQGEYSTSGIEYVPIIGTVAVLTGNDGAEMNNKMLVFTFDDNDKVLKYMLNDATAARESLF